MLLIVPFSISYATKKDDDGCRGNCSGDEADTITSTVTVGGQNQLQEQSQQLSNSSTNTNTNSNSAASSSSASQSLTGNTQAVNVTNTSPDDVTIRNVASPDTPNPYPTAPCRVGISAGFSLAGGALSGGGSVEDEECTLRETARSFKDLGVPELGLILLCEQSEVITGKKDKKGELEKGEVAFGSQRCLDLVARYLDGPEDAAGAAKEAEQQLAAKQEIEALERQLEIAQETSQQTLMEVDELRELVERTRGQAQTIYREYLSDDKKAALNALLTDEETGQ